MSTQLTKTRVLNRTNQDQIVNIDLSHIKSNPYHFRKEFFELNELAESIENIGLLHSVLVRKSDSEYIIIAGERRFRAYKRLTECYPDRYNEIACRVIDSEIDSQLFALTENIHRMALTTYDECKAVYDLIRTIKLNYKELGSFFGRSEDFVEKRVRYIRMNEALKKRTAAFSDNIFYKKLDELLLTKVLMLKPLYTHFTEIACYDFLSRIIDEELSVREIKAELSAYSQNKIQRRLLQCPKEKSELFQTIDELNILEESVSVEPVKKVDSGLTLFKKPRGELKSHKENRKLIGFQEEFWERLLKLIQEKLKVVIKTVIPFKQAFEHLVELHSKSFT